MLACILALIALPLMVWPIFVPTVWPVMIALSLGQILGTLSFAMFLIVVVRDMQLSRKLDERKTESLRPVD